MDKLVKGLSASFSMRGIGGILAVIAVLIALEYTGYGPGAIAARAKARA